MYATSMKDRIVRAAKDRARELQEAARPGSAAKELEDALDAAEGVEGRRESPLDDVPIGDDDAMTSTTCTRRGEAGDGPPADHVGLPAEPRARRRRRAGRLAGRLRLLAGHPRPPPARRSCMPSGCAWTRRDDMRRPRRRSAVLGVLAVVDRLQVVWERRELLVASRRARPGRRVRSSRPMGRHAGGRLPGHDHAARRLAGGTRSRRSASSRAGAVAWPRRRSSRVADGRGAPGSVDVPRTTTCCSSSSSGGRWATAPTWPGRSRPSWPRALAQDAEDVERERLARDHPRRRPPGARLHPPPRRRHRRRGGRLAPSRPSRSARCAPWSAACPSTSWRGRSAGRGRPPPYLRQASRRHGRPRRVRPTPSSPPASPRTRWSPRSRPRSTTSASTPGPAPAPGSSSSDAGDDIVVTVRDNGVGVSEERIAEARQRGRIGVSASIRGRVEDLGGSARYLYGPGGGTMVEMWIPKRGA